jgi:hypothetical protein
LQQLNNQNKTLVQKITGTKKKNEKAIKLTNVKIQILEQVIR